MRQMHLSEKTTRTVTTPGRLLFLSILATLLLFLPSHGALADSPAPTRTTLAVLPTAAANGEGVTLTATVTTSAGAPVTGGSVDFEIADGQSLGSAIVGADGTATLALAKVPVGSSTAIDGTSQLQVAAVFNPVAPAATSTDAGMTGSRSIATAVASPQATTPVAPAFIVTGNPATVTAAQGSYGTSILTVTSVGGYAGSIQFSCSGLPAQVTCAFNPTQANLSANGAFTSTLQLQTQGPSGTASSSLLPRSTGVALAMAFPGALLLFGLSRRRGKGFRGMQMLGIALLLTGTGLGLSGCSQRYGYLHHPPSVAGGTPIGTFPIKVAIDGTQGSSVSETIFTVSLVVQ